jgi:cephalosporin hydroxylase
MIENYLGATVKQLLPVWQQRSFQTTYQGILAIKNPCDAWVYQEIIWEEKPDVIIEIGVHSGGGSLMLAHILDNIGHGKYIGIDIDLRKVPQRVKDHPRVTLLEGDACQLYDTVVSMLPGNARVLIIEDSSHTYENTLKILNKYHNLISVGDYFIVEDGICNHGLDGYPHVGVYEAITDFTTANTNFVSVRDMESFLMTSNPKGFIKRTS